MWDTSHATIHPPRALNTFPPTLDITPLYWSIFFCFNSFLRRPNPPLSYCKILLVCIKVSKKDWGDFQRQFVWTGLVLVEGIPIMTKKVSWLPCYHHQFYHQCHHSNYHHLKMVGIECGKMVAEMAMPHLEPLHGKCIVAHIAFHNIWFQCRYALYRQLSPFKDGQYWVWRLSTWEMVADRAIPHSKPTLDYHCCTAVYVCRLRGGTGVQCKEVAHKCSLRVHLGENPSSGGTDRCHKSSAGKCNLLVLISWLLQLYSMQSVNCIAISYLVRPFLFL